MTDKRYRPKRIVLSHSTTGTLTNCPRQYELAHAVNLGGGSQDQFAADVGHALHDGVQEYVRTRELKRSLFKFLTSFPYDGEYAPERHGRKDRSLEACVSAFQSMACSFDWSRYEPAQFHVGDSVVDGIEISFAIQLLNTGCDIPIYFMGHIDLVLYELLTRKYVIFDLKTTRQSSKLLEPHWRFDQQTVPYGLIIPALEGKPIGDLTTHYVVTYIDLMEPKTVDFPVTNTEEQIQDWAMGLADTVLRVRRYLRTQWPRSASGAACVTFNTPCRFFDVCASRDTERLLNLYPPDENSPDKDFYNPDKATLQVQLDMQPFIKEYDE